jgi:hypothetical protein
MTAVFAAGAWAADAGEAASPCGPNLPAAEIRVVAEHAIPHVDHTRPATEIARQLNAAPHNVALGLTHTSTTLSVDMLLKALEAAEDALLREIERDACVSAVVLEHEMKHVAIERDTLDWAAQQLETQLQVWYAERVLRGTEAQIKAGLVQDFEERWTPALEALLQSSTPRHVEHDRQDSYGDAQACGGELYQTARRMQ